MHKIIKKTGILNLLLICVLAGALRWLAMGMVTSVPMLIAIQFFLHPFTWPIMLYVVSIYIQKSVPDQLNARGQTIANMILASVARAIGNIGGGFLVNSYGDAMITKIFCGLSAVTFAVLIVMMVIFCRMGWGLRRTPEAMRLEENTVI